MKADLEPAVGDPAIGLVLAFDPHLALQPSAAVMNDCAGAVLAGFAMTDIDAVRLSRRDRPQLSAMTFRHPLPNVPFSPSRPEVSSPGLRPNWATTSDQGSVCRARSSSPPPRPNPARPRRWSRVPPASPSTDAVNTALFGGSARRHLRHLDVKIGRHHPLRIKGRAAYPISRRFVPNIRGIG